MTYGTSWWLYSGPTGWGNTGCAQLIERNGNTHLYLSVNTGSRSYRSCSPISASELESLRNATDRILGSEPNWIEAYEEYDPGYRTMQERKDMALLVINTLTLRVRLLKNKAKRFDQMMALARVGAKP